MEILIGIIGLCIGSFLNVVAHRLPGRISLIQPGSRCPVCAHPLGPIDLIPLLGFLYRRGACHYCRADIPRYYPIIEAVTALGFVGVVHGYGLGIQAVRLCSLLCLLLVAALTDREHGVIPNRLILTGLVIGVSVFPFLDQSARVESLLAGLSAGGILFGARWLGWALYRQPGMGMGDVKLAAVIGLLMGWWAMAVLAAAIFFAGLIGAWRLSTGCGDRHERLAFAPFLTAGYLVVICLDLGLLRTGRLWGWLGGW